MLVAAATVATARADGDAAFGDWRRCVGETTRVAARENRLPEEMPLLLHEACPDQRGRYLKASGLPEGTRSTTRIDATIADYLRRYAFFSSTGVWPAH